MWGTSSRPGPALGGVETARNEGAANLMADGALRFTRVVHAASTSCGLAPDGVAWCWGRPLDGQLGDGWTARRYSPHEVVGGHAFGR